MLLKYNIMNKLNDYESGFISGFLDADGSLIIIKKKNKKVKRGWTIDIMVCFSNNNISLLKYIQQLIGIDGTFITVQDSRSDKFNDQSRLTYNANTARKLLPQLKLIHKEDKRIMMLDILNTKQEKNSFRYDYNKVEYKLKKWLNYKYDYGEETLFKQKIPTEFDTGYFKGFLMGDGHCFNDGIQLTNNSAKILNYLRDISCVENIYWDKNIIGRIIPTFRIFISKNKLKSEFYSMDKNL